MKKIIFYELMRNLKHKPHLQRKLKIFVAIGIVGFLITGGIVIWAGISAMGYVAAKATQVVQSPSAQQHLESLKTEVQALPKIQTLNCWDKAQSLMAVEPWLARPALDNLNDLRVACLEQRPAVCEGHECTQMKKQMHTAEGTMI